MNRLLDELQKKVDENTYQMGSVITTLSAGVFWEEAIEIVRKHMEGKVLVPVEPTEEMIALAESVYISTYTGTPVATPNAIYKAMLKAAEEQ